MFALVAMAGLAKEIKMNDSRGDRHLGYSSRHTQVSVPATKIEEHSYFKIESDRSKSYGLKIK